MTLTFGKHSQDIWASPAPCVLAFINKRIKSYRIFLPSFRSLKKKKKANSNNSNIYMVKYYYSP